MHSSSGGEVLVRGGSFEGNDALGGGGLSNAGGGTLDVTGTRFSDNHADEQGGGILIESGAVRMVDIDVVGNVAAGAEEAGGGISYAGDKPGVLGESAAIEASRIRDNEATGPGGGIDSRGDGLLSVVTTSITGNTAAAGGAIHHVGDAPLEVTRSTLSGNLARDDGGGVLTDGDGEATIVNSTVSGNHAGQFGGGVLVSSRLTLLSSTVAANSAASGGGVDSGGGDQVGDGTVSLRNTIVAASATGGNCAGTITSLGGNVEDADTCLLRGPRDHARTDPRLGALADNGGPTRTHALLAGSPAQDTAWCSLTDPCPAVDQRGVARPLFGVYDAGAYESETAPAAAPCAGAAERPVAAVADSWVSQSAPSANFGSDATLKVGAGGRALIRFALPAVPAGCKLVGATLRLHSRLGDRRTDARGAARPVDLERERGDVDQPADGRRRRGDRSVRHRARRVGRARAGARHVRGRRARLRDPGRGRGDRRRAVVPQPRAGRRARAVAPAALRRPRRSAAAERVPDEPAADRRGPRQLDQPGQPGEQLRRRFLVEGAVAVGGQLARARPLRAAAAPGRLHRHRLGDPAGGGVVREGGPHAGGGPGGGSVGRARRDLGQPAGDRGSRCDGAVGCGCAGVDRDRAAASICTARRTTAS